MAYAVTHILVPMVLLDLLRHYYFGSKKFPRYLIVVGGIAGLMPDMDILISWIYSWINNVEVNFHGMFTHSLLFPILFLLLAIYFGYNKNGKWRNIFYVIAFGWLMHIGLDWLFGEYKALFWPFITTNPTLFPTWKWREYSAAIDAILLTLWIINEEVHGYIKDYF